MSTWFTGSVQKTFNVLEGRFDVWFFYFIWLIGGGYHLIKIWLFSNVRRRGNNKTVTIKSIYILGHPVVSMDDYRKFFFSKWSGCRGELHRAYLSDTFNTIFYKPFWHRLCILNGPSPPKNKCASITCYTYQTGLLKHPYVKLNFWTSLIELNFSVKL